MMLVHMQLFCRNRHNCNIQREFRRLKYTNRYYSNRVSGISSLNNPKDINVFRIGGFGVSILDQVSSLLLQTNNEKLTIFVYFLLKLRFEELLLRHTSGNHLIINHGKNIGGLVDTDVSLRRDSRNNKISIVMGMSGKAPLLLHTDKVRDSNIQVLRRYTGGGTVIVDENTFFVSLIMDNSLNFCPPYPREIMAWTADAIYSPTFSEMLSMDLGLQFKLREHDYIFEELSDPSKTNIASTEGREEELYQRKIGGNAQTITKGRWAHHTSFLWDFDPSNMDYLQVTWYL